MSIRVYGGRQNPAVDPFLYRCSNSSGEFTVSSGRGKFITAPDGRLAVQLLSGVKTMRERARRNPIKVFARVIDKLTHPPRLHYPVPAVADHRLAWINSFMAIEHEDHAIA
jgi:hypothetical protein